MEGVRASDKLDTGETTELDSLLSVRPGTSILGCGEPDDGDTAPTFRRPVTAGGAGNCVEIERTGGPLASRIPGTPAIWENLVAGVGPEGGAGVEAATAGAGTAGEGFRTTPLEKFLFSSSASKEFTRGRDVLLSTGGGIAGRSP